MDLILVGDSVAMVVLGYDDTLQVTVDDMAHHTAAVARARPEPMIVADLPWLSYHTGISDAVTNAATLVRAGAQAVKLEGGRKRVGGRRGHRRRRDPGHGPPGPHPPVGPRHGRLQGPGHASSTRPGPWSTTPRRWPTRAASPSCSKASPTRSPAWSPSGAGARPSGSAPDRGATARCSSSTTWSAWRTGAAPKFVRRYADLGADAVAAVGEFAADVRSRKFPSDAESYHLTDDVARALRNDLG